MSNVKEVNSNKFDALMSKSIKLAECHKCDKEGGQIIIDMPSCGGKDGAYCKCYVCGYETRRRSMNITIIDNENQRMGTPVTEKSIMGAIRQAANDWNGGIKMENRELEYGLQELRECPFCGGEARIATNFAMEQFVVCRNCEGLFWVGKSWDEESVIAAWNRRAKNDNN